MNDKYKYLGTYLSQSEAAALAVLAASVRNNVEVNAANTKDERTVTIEETSEVKEVISFLKDLEEIAIDSITSNDGNVVHWIGIAAKQMNPLL